MMNRNRLAIYFLLLFSLIAAGRCTEQTPASRELTFSRPVRTWEFMPAVGTKAALFGHESGIVEGWVYPMKLFRDFSLVFHVAGQNIPAESLARTIEVHPEA